ncbi:MAG: DUF1385 domain-containing protein [Thermoleophilaceae bacterium]
MSKLRLGGMALRNGLLVHGPTHWAAAVRAADGSVKTASGRKPRFAVGLAGRVPGVRGVARLAEAFAVIPLVKAALPEARLPMQDRRTLGAMAGATLAGHALRRTGPASAGREVAMAALGLAPALLALRGGDLASYHGVEHKAIAAYEQDGEAVDAAKEHDRCGSNLVAPLMASTVAGNLAMRRAGLRGPTADAAVALGSVAVAVEVFAWSERHAGTALAKALRRPGYELQRALGTREPTGEQLEVGQAALAEILRAEGAGSST